MATIVCELPPEGNTLFVNNAITKVLGFTPEELIDKNWWDTLFSQEQRFQLDKIYKNFQYENISKYDTNLTAKDGSLKTVEWDSFNYFQQDGALKRIILFGIDVTRRVTAMEKLLDISLKQ
jgi:PAS domain S-box-containing protein